MFRHQRSRPVKRILLFTIPVLAVGILCGCNMASQGLNMEGARMHQQGNYLGAMRKFQEAVANNPDNADAYYNLAATFHSMGKLNARAEDYQQAEHYYNQALDKKENHTDAYRGLTVLLVETGRPDAAERLLNGWVMRQPSSPDAKIELARLKDELGQTEEAKARLLEAIEIDPNNDRALTALGRIRERSGEYLQALSNYERSLQANRFQPNVSSRVAALQGVNEGQRILNPIGNTRLVRDPGRWSRY